LQNCTWIHEGCVRSSIPSPVGTESHCSCPGNVGKEVLFGLGVCVRSVSAFIVGTCLLTVSLLLFVFVVVGLFGTAAMKAYCTLTP
jgi:hypothetical protein